MRRVARPKRSSGPAGSCVKRQYASSTWTWAMVTGSGPSFNTDTTNPSGPSSTRENASSSTAGASPRTVSAGFEATIHASKPASSTSGSNANSQDLVAFAGIALDRLEHAHPAELGELALVGVEHETTGVAESGLEDRALALAQHEGVGDLGALRQRAGAVHGEEHAVQVEAVHRVELGDVDQVDPHQFADFDADRLRHVEVRGGVHRVDFVVGVEVGVEAVHHHHHLVGRRPRHAWIDDEGAV